MHHTKKEKLFRGPNILIISLYLNFCTKIRPFWFFGYPVLLKWQCFSLVYLFLKKSTTNVPHHKCKTFHETQYFDHILISQFLHQNKAIFIFWTPFMAKWPCISFVYPFLIKCSTNASYNKGKTFHKTQHFDHILISQFFHQNKAIVIFWTPCMAEMVFY